MFLGNFLELRDVEEPGKIVEVEHALVLAVFTEEGHVLTEIHVFEVISDKAAVTALYAFAEFK